MPAAAAPAPSERPAGEKRQGQKQSQRPPLHEVLPPLILGTATFNTQYVDDPRAMPYRRIVSRAIELGVNCFDTSPYYGPSEELLGEALAALTRTAEEQQTDADGADAPNLPLPLPLPRSAYTLVTKAGRIGPDEFDYSPAHIRASVQRSLRRLRTPYLDVVYAHDVEFVSPAEVLDAVRELRRLRDDEEGGSVVRYVGISGYPVATLCSLAELVLAETGEPLDAVLSYGNFTVQNRTLGAREVDDDDSGDGDHASPLARLRAAGVDVVLNASMLGMGLLTTLGIPPDPETPATVPVAAAGDSDNTTTTVNGDRGGDGDGDDRQKRPSLLAKWHPSPPALRLACKELGAIAAAAGERLETVAIRWSLEEWARVAAAAGFGVDAAIPHAPGRLWPVGTSVMGVSSVAELEETVREWEGVLAGLAPVARDAATTTDIVANSTNGTNGTNGTRKYLTARQEKVIALVQMRMWPSLGPWKDYSWASPGPDFRNRRRKEDAGGL